MSDRQNRAAFTLLEVLISVMLISIVVLGIVKIRIQNIDAARYLSTRLQSQLNDSLFFEERLNSSQREKNAYEALETFGIQKTTTLEILKKIRRTVTLSPALPIGDLPLPLQLKTLTLHGDYTTRYYRLFFKSPPSL